MFPFILSSGFDESEARRRFAGLKPARFLQKLYTNERLIQAVADRGTMTVTDMMRKLRAYFQFIKRQQRHKEAFGIHPVRAVLIETTNEARARKLMELVSHPLVVGPDRRSALFWFTISPLFTEASAGEPKSLAPYLVQPEIVFTPIWALPDRTLHALGDVDNFPVTLDAVGPSAMLPLPV